MKYSKRISSLFVAVKSLFYLVIILVTKFFHYKKNDNNPSLNHIIFLHIPKTAGTSFNTAIQTHYRREKRLKASGSNKDIEEFCKANYKNLKDKEIVYGHLNFGIHAFLPNDFRYITIIREPVSRIVSHFFFVKNNASHHLHNYIKTYKPTIKEYVASGISNELNNGQVRIISGLDSYYGFGDCPLSMLEMAFRNLKEYFLLLGLFEDLESFSLRLQDEFKIKFINNLIFNKTMDKQKNELLDHDTIETIKYYNRLDISLYEEIKRCRCDLNNIKNH